MQGPANNIQFLGAGPRTSRDSFQAAASGSLPRLPSIEAPPARLAEDILAERMELEAESQRRGASSRAGSPETAQPDEFAGAVEPALGPVTPHQVIGQILSRSVQANWMIQSKCHVVIGASVTMPCPFVLVPALRVGRSICQRSSAGAELQVAAPDWLVATPAASPAPEGILEAQKPPPPPPATAPTHFANNVLPPHLTAPPLPPDTQ